MDPFEHIDRYPERAGWKEPTTSRDAARAVDDSGVKQKVYRLVRERLLYQKLTAKELAVAIGMDKDSVKPRLTEMKEDGQISWVVESYLDEGQPKYLIRDRQHVWELVR